MCVFKISDEFYFRIYVLITSLNPLRIYMYEDGLGKSNLDFFKFSNSDSIVQLINIY